MLSRSEMRQLMQAARNNWDVPLEKKREAIAQVREVLNSAEASERATETALAAMNVFEAAGWMSETADLLQ